MKNNESAGFLLKIVVLGRRMEEILSQDGVMVMNKSSQ